MEITRTAAELLAMGLDLQGIWMYDPNAEQDRLLGPVIGIEEDFLLTAGPDGTRRFNPERCWPEASVSTFTALFEQVLRPIDRAAYEETEWLLQAENASGRGYVRRLDDTVRYFQSLGVLEAAPSVKFKFGDLVTVSFATSTPQAEALSPVMYCFSSDRNALDEFPSRGLNRFGPFDSRTFDKKSPRLLIVAPQEQRGEADEFVRRLLEGMAKDKQGRFAGGLGGIYRFSKIIPQYLSVPLPRTESLDIGSRYVASIQQAFDPSRPPDIALVFLRDDDAFSEKGNPYLAVKAYLLSQGIPSQEIRLSSTRNRSGLPYTLENVAVALYAKLGGSPWTVLPTMPIAQEIVLGMGIAEVGGRFRSRKRYVGITTIFRSDGTYLLAAASPRCQYEEYPQVLARFVEDTLRRLAVEQNWQEGDLVRLVFHARKPLKRTDVGAIVGRAIRQLGMGVQFETAFLTIHKDHPFKVVDPRERGRERFVELAGGGFGRRTVGTCVPMRGTAIDLGEDRRLLCVTGTSLVKREGEPISQPLLIELHPDSTYRDLSSLVRQVYHFTGLSWRSMLPVGEPVTIFYSHLIADLLGRLDKVPHWSDGLLDTRLRRSRWFL